ncbi:MAG: F0F1 ATP synthase subunit delta [Desulfamplus sp.]|nr:F0F1 ATP synthase subunit delta [Desulfamplus sp.]
MIIDWFTVGAQTLNFLILVWLMKHFLYKPVLNAIDAREKRIATELSDADTKKIEAQKEIDTFKHKNEEFDRQRSELLRKATEEASEERQRLLEKAGNDAEDLGSKHRERLRNETHDLHREIRGRVQHGVFAIARKALTEFATTTLEERLGEVFTRRLRGMESPEKERLAQALGSASDPSVVRAVVRSAFDLPTEQRTVIQNALNETVSADIRIRFETRPDLISGIELTANGQKVAWSISDYLSSLEKDIDELLKKNNIKES